MIDKVEVLDANYSGLEEKFPKGLELDTNSDIVLLLGPNNVGKTAFLRMLATSLDFHRYFRENGISYYWDYSADGIENPVSEVIESLRKAKEVEEGWFVFNTKWNRTVFNGLCRRNHISYADQVREIYNDGSRFPGYSAVFDVISRDGKDIIFQLEALLKSPTDENVWGFIKPTISGEGDVYYQPFDLPQDRYVAHEQKVGLKKYSHFINTDKFYGSGTSPGRDLYRKLESFFERRIAQFFEERRVPKWEREDYSLEGRAKKFFGMGGERPHDEIPEGSRLCVMMDEPTIFLDTVNKFRFQRKMMEMVERYSGRLQFFIASNDYALIKGLEGNCVYVNMYEQPVTSSRTFDVHKYVSSSGENF